MLGYFAFQAVETGTLIRWGDFLNGRTMGSYEAWVQGCIGHIKMDLVSQLSIQVYSKS